MEIITTELRARFPMELLYADDFVLMAASAKRKNTMEIRVGSQRFEGECRENEDNVQL